MEEPEYETAEEVAARLRLHLETVRQLLREGKLPGVKIGRSWRIRRKDLEEFLRPGGATQE
jgi:excisionase family DNA binding protein